MSTTYRFTEPVPLREMCGQVAGLKSEPSCPDYSVSCICFTDQHNNAIHAYSVEAGADTRLTRYGRSDPGDILNILATHVSAARKHEVAIVSETGDEEYLGIESPVKEVKTTRQYRDKMDCEICREHDTVYYLSLPNPQKVTINAGPVDWLLLAKQMSQINAHLGELYTCAQEDTGKPDATTPTIEALEGLMKMTENIRLRAQEAGFPVVWYMDECKWEQGE